MIPFQGRSARRPISVFGLILALSISWCNYILGQTDDYDEEHITSSLPNFSSASLNTEYYKFNAREQAIYLLANGKLEIDDRNYLNLEIISSFYKVDDSYVFTWGDFSITYTRNLYSNKFLNPGFQGISPSLKLIMPTGDSDYSGLFGHWIIEPAIYYSWLFRNDHFFLSNRWRLFLPFSNSKDAVEPPMFIRFEPRFGYENKKLWTSLTLDNRWIFNQEEYVLFYRLDFGYKLNEHSGFSSFFTQRIFNTVLFKIYTGLSYYYIF